MRLRTLALAAAVAVAGPALAKRVNITGYQPSSTEVSVTFSSTSPGTDLLRRGASVATDSAPPADDTYFVQAGQLTGMLDGATFLTYCAEVLAPIAFGTPNVPGPTYNVEPAPPQFGYQRTLDLSRLFTAAYDPVSDADHAAAFQLAVWEIIYEQPSPNGTYPTYNLKTGSFSALNPGGTAFDDINGILSNLGSYDKLYKVEVLTNPTYQDYLLVTSVPEPGTYAMLVAGLGVLGFAARRRRPSAS